MSTVRLRRLNADAVSLTDYISRHPRLKLIQQHGDPPERYQIEFRIRSLRMQDGQLVDAKSHIVEIHLPRNYPRTPPQCRMLSPVFHPNIAPHAICVGDHWSPGESLQSIVARIGEMLAYQSYNVKSPLNGEAARWVEQNGDRLPLDDVSLLVEEHAEGDVADIPYAASAGAPVASQAAPPRAAVPLAVAPPPPAAPDKLPAVCPHCQTRYRIRPDMLGRTVQCKTCQQPFKVQAAAP
jgi:predicted Zn finger-like uncharacterized protein